MSTIIDSLRQEHRDIEQLLVVLEEEMEVFDRGGLPDYEIVQAIIGYLQDYPDCCHHPKENMIFARLRARDPVLAGSLGDLEVEHESEAQSLQRVAYTVWRILSNREVTPNSFDQVMREFIDTERKHMELEERTVFPAATKALCAEDWVAIEAAWRHKSDSLFNVGIGEKCHSARERIRQWQQLRRSERRVTR